MKHLLISFTLLGLLLGQVSAWAESEQPWQEASEAQLKQVLAGFEAIATLAASSAIRHIAVDRAHGRNLKGSTI